MSVKKLLKFKQVCEVFGIEPFDIGCPWCVEEMRTAWGCAGTCRLMGWDTCPQLIEKDNCGCPDGTKEKGLVIGGLYVGFNVLPELAALAAYYCPDGSAEVRYQLSGNTTIITCPTTPGSPVLFNGGHAEELDMEGGPIARTESGRCVGGPIFIDAGALGIVTDPLPIGAPPGSVSCSQSGGMEMLIMRISANCNDKQIVLCPFPGAGGAPFTCGVPPNYCDRWELTEENFDGCTVELTFTHFPGECPVVVTVNGTVLEGDSMTLVFVIDPCSPGNSITVTIVKEWSTECIHQCSINNGTTVLTYTVPDA